MKYPLMIEYSEFPKLDLFNWLFYVTDKKYFKIDLLDVKPNLLTLTNREDCLRLENNPLLFYQNQFNMAIWFSTTGCGISVNDHLNHKDPMVRSVYKFHTYYHIRKIFKNLKIPIPGDDSFNEVNNQINRKELKKLLADFGLNDEYEFSTFNANNGWESWSVPNYDPNITDPAYYINDSKLNVFLQQVYENRVPPMFEDDFDKGMDNFRYRDTFIKTHVRRHKNIIKSIEQKPNQTYQPFLDLNSKKLTRRGLQWLNESIRTYVYCVLAAQTDTRTPIIGQFGTELDAQQQFKSLLENAIAEAQDMKKSIERYQNALGNAHKQLDYVIGPGLYIIPSNMILNINSVDNYNNNIQIATEEMKTGKNSINHLKQKPPKLMEGSPIIKSTLKTNIEKIEKPEKPEKIEKTEKPVKVKKEETETHETIKFILFATTGAIVTFLVFSFK